MYLLQIFVGITPIWMELIFLVPAVKNLRDLAKYIQNKIDSVLLDEVAEKVKDIQTEAIQQTVYDAYPRPVMYERRRNYWGLMDKRNMPAVLEGSGVLSVSNETPLNDVYGVNPSGKSLTEIVVSGEGYMFHNGGEYEQPRDFIEATREKLSESGALAEALQKGLNRRGIETK
jgi:hypothetical protein